MALFALERKNTTKERKTKEWRRRAGSGTQL